MKNSPSFDIFIEYLMQAIFSLSFSFHYFFFANINWILLLTLCKLNSILYFDKKIHRSNFFWFFGVRIFLRSVYFSDWFQILIRCFSHLLTFGNRTQSSINFDHKNSQIRKLRLTFAYLTFPCQLTFDFSFVFIPHVLRSMLLDLAKIINKSAIL